MSEDVMSEGSEVSMCEKCWQDARGQVLLLGGNVADRYRELLKERHDNPCSPEQQSRQSTKPVGRTADQLPPTGAKTETDNV